MNTNQVQDLMQDILAIRRSINSYEMAKENKIGVSAHRANMHLQMTALVLAAMFALVEIGFDHWIYRALMFTARSNDMKIWAIGAIGLFLVLCNLNLYFVIRRAARQSQDTVETYVKRNFVYLRRLSHISDLTIKFLVVAGFIVALVPQMVAPFLLLFIADYLLQGRFFTLKLNVAYGLAAVTFILAGLQFWFGQGEVLWPLLWYCVVNVASILNLKNTQRIEI